MPIQSKPGERLIIEKQRIRDETLIVRTTIEGDNFEVADLFRHSEFVNCSFDIVKPTNGMFARCRFFNCVFRPRKRVNIWIGDNYWEGCTFYGYYDSTHFGFSSDDIHGPSEWPDVALRGCDFSQAIMRVCGFRRLDIDSTKFPPWPCFTVLHPYKNQKETFVAAGLPSSSIVSYSVNDAGLSAIMYHWPSLVKKMVTPPDPEAVMAALQKLDFVRL